MIKRSALFMCLLLASSLSAFTKSTRPESQPSRPLTKTQQYIRTVGDFLLFDRLGMDALSPENEQFIKEVIHDLDMDDYCIEIRRMSNLAQRLYGRANASAIASPLNKKRHAYLYVSEKWFETLSAEAKQALIRHELMHIKLNHTPKKIVASILLAISFKKLEASLKKIIFEQDSPVKPARHDVLEVDYTKNLTRLVTSIAASLLICKYVRSFEKEADIEALKTMASKEGFIYLVKSTQSEMEDPESRFAFSRTIERYTQPIADLFSSHPTFDERIAYAQQL